MEEDAIPKLMKDVFLIARPLIIVVKLRKKRKMPMNILLNPN
jgi:hypothetical protein